jgi:hypothetical protein
VEYLRIIKALRKAGAALLLSYLILATRQISIRPRHDVSGPRSASGKCGDKVCSCDNANDFSVLYDGNGISITIRHNGEECSDRGIGCHARHCDAHDVTCRHRSCSITIQKALEGWQEATMQAQRIFSGLTDKMHLKDDA